MKLNSLLRFGVVTLLLSAMLLPLSAFRSTASPVAAGAAGEDKDDLVFVTPTLGPSLLTASYKGHSGCAATNHEFSVSVDVLDATNNIYRVKNLLDEGIVLKARLKDGKLNMGRQKMGSYVVTGNIEYLENPARIETKVRFEDGLGYCEDVSSFLKQ